ncbi:response regulator transcription factor [Myxococcaceae bacterium JPH2]|nr:response regulator transcription factor [Myxococcaceae bacterium JPH2]
MTAPDESSGNLPDASPEAGQPTVTTRRTPCCKTGVRDRLCDIAIAYAQKKGLSARESEVFTRFVSKGRTSKEIAAELGIAYPTVKLYWTRIYRKLDCDDAVGALVAFVREMTQHLHCERCGAGPAILLGAGGQPDHVAA